MSLTSHNYIFFSERDAFLQKWSMLFDELVGDEIEGVLGVWDNLDACWFGEAPMLVKLSSGVLSVNVKSEHELAVGWNDIFLYEKPVWFDENDEDKIAGLGWQEDLDWKGYMPVDKAIGRIIREIQLISDSCGNGLTGLRFILSNGAKLDIYDAGDVIAARVVDFTEV